MKHSAFEEDSDRSRFGNTLKIASGIGALAGGSLGAYLGLLHGGVPHSVGGLIGGIFAGGMVPVLLVWFILVAVPFVLSIILAGIMFGSIAYFIWLLAVWLGT